MPRGRKKTHKGGHRHFTNQDEQSAKKEREDRERQWRRQKGMESDEEEGEEGHGEKGAAAPQDPFNRDLPPSESETESSEEEEVEAKSKGVSHLIDIENPNYAKKTSKKVVDLGEKAELSRREREEVEKQQAKANYQKMHEAGKTEEARADLARLALIRKQREETARKREEESKAKEKEEEKIREKRNKGRV